MPDSPPIYLLSPDAKEGVYSLPMIRFETSAQSIDFSGCDTLMFTSKQAVRIADAISKEWKSFPAVAVGGATKKEIESLGGQVIYFPENFYGKSLAEDIADFFADRHILYLRPREVLFDSKGYLAKSGIVLEERIIYETYCIEYEKQMQPPESSIIIFTSPSTIHCFLKNFDWLPSYRAVVIGESTKVHLPPKSRYYVAKRALIDSCVEKAFEVAAKS